MRDELLKIFTENNGYLLSKQLTGSTMRYQLNRMLATGEASRVKNGLYVLSDFQGYDERQLVAGLIPEGVFCLFSAWDFYELTTTIPREHHIALHRNTRVRLPGFPPIRLYFWSDKYYKLGISEIKSGDKTLRIYNLERAVCDAFRFRNKAGQEMCTEVLRNYLLRNDANIDLLIRNARELRIEKIISPYLFSMV